MLRVWAVLLSLLVTVSLHAGGLTKHWQKLIVGGATLAMLHSGAELVADVDDWRPVRVGRADTTSHYAASFYLVLDFGEVWRTMHVQYIGNDVEGTPLVVGSRAYIVSTVEDNDLILEDTTMISLVGANGLIAEGVDVQEIGSLSSPAGAGFNLTILGIDGVDLDEIKPIPVAETYPELDTELEMISYRADLADNLIGFFDYPAMRRNCVAGNFFPNEGLAVNTCTAPQTPASLGSPLFIKDSGQLIGFYYGIVKGWTIEIDGEKHLVGRTVVAPSALQEFTTELLAVEPHNKATVSWGKLKQR